MSYPILVERWDAEHPSGTVVCERCHASFAWDPGEGEPEDLCLKHGGYAPGACGGALVWKYIEAPRCGGCGKLGHWEKVLGYCCSRVCMLQAEYAESLKARA